MADLHLYNQKLRDKSKAEENTVGTFTLLLRALGPGVSTWVGAHGGVFTVGRIAYRLPLRCGVQVRLLSEKSRGAHRWVGLAHDAI